MTRIADEDARRRACREFARPLVVVAGAGTGKTTTLVARVATWLVGPGWDESAGRESADGRAAERAVDGVLAITFTKAAAAEMDARVRAALREIESGRRPTGVALPDDAAEPDERTRVRARHLRLALDRPLATTIHGFCQGLLAEHPFESGLAPGFTVDADAEAVAELARRAATEDLAGAFRAPERDEDWLRLARAGVGPDAVAASVRGLRVEGVRAEDLAADPASDAVLARLLEELAPAASAFVPACRTLAALRGTNIVGAARAVIALAETLAGRADQPLLEVVRAIPALMDDGPLDKLRAWSAGRFDDSAVKALGAEHDAACAAAARFGAAFLPLARFDVDGFRARLAVVRRVLARAERLGDEAAVVTFGDLLARAARLVASDRGVRDRLRRRYRQILVDEFQDTDDVQVGIVRALALGEGPGPPGLFLVGDPKQSIYGFRGADLAAYDDFVAEVLAAGGEEMQLVQNFRSTPRVLDAVQRFVEPVMDEERGVQPRFQPLVPIGDEPGPDVELWATWAPTSAAKSLSATGVGTARRLEAAQLAHSLETRHAAGTPWKDMAVLARSRTGLDVCFEALREAGIPYQVEGDRSYYRRREIVDAAALLGAIVDPGDTLSLLAYLRSSACGLPDAALESLWSRGFATDAQMLGAESGERALSRIRAALRDVAEELESRGSPDGRGIPHFAAAAEHALESLAILRRSLREDTADRFVERLRELVLFEAAESGRYQGRFRAANLERFLRRVGAAFEESGDATAVLRALRRSIDERREAKEARPSSAVEDAVRFLTIHGAKGLEFEAVYLIGLANDRNRGDSKDGFDRRTGALRLCGAASPGWVRVDEARRKRDAAERARLLYVALTRAKRHLALSAVWNAEPKGRGAREAANFRDLAENGLPEGFGARAAAALGANEIEYRDGEFVVRLACTERAAGRAEIEARAETGFVGRARADASVLARLGPVAELRARRPRIAAASGEPVERIAGAQGTSAITRDDARTAGVLVHAALELAPDFAASRARLERDADALRAPTAARAEARTILEGVASGPIADRMRRVASSILARELALLAPARDSEAPLDGWTGSADLVLREGSAWTVVDFKSEHLGGRAARDVAREHAPQLDLYARALAEALALTSMPRREVWFLRDGIVAEIA